MSVKSGNKICTFFTVFTLQTENNENLTLKNMRKV